MPLISDRGIDRCTVRVGLCIAVLTVLAVMQASAYAAGIDWDAIVKEHRGKGDLSIREHFELAIAYANTGDILGARREFEALDREGWHDEAQKMLSESEERLEENPDSVIDLNVVAFTSYVMQDYERSCVTFERILEVDEANDWPRLYLAWTYGSLGRIDEGIAELEYMVKRHPLNVYVRLLLMFAKAQR